MLKQLGLTKGQSSLGAATRSCSVGQHKSIVSAAVLWQNCARLATFDSNPSVFTPISIRYYSSNRNDTNLPGDDKSNQIIQSDSIKTAKLSNTLRRVSIKKESNKGNAQTSKKIKLLQAEKLKKTKLLQAEKLKKTKLLQAEKLKKTKLLQAEKLKKTKLLELQKLKKAKLLELQKLKKAKLLEAQKKQIAKQKKKATMKKLKLNNKSSVNKRLVVPSFPSSSRGLFIKDEYAKIKNDLLDSTHVLSTQNKIKDISLKWKLMAEAEKLEYEQKYKLLKEQFTATLYKWWDTIDKNLVKMENRRRKNINKIRKSKGINALAMLVDPRAPKRPPHSYAMFVKDIKKSNHPDLPNNKIDFIKYVAAKWNKLPETEKNIYRDKYNVVFKLYKENSNNSK
ncbi:hypothetical protein BB561_003073 [Smittium simulii]|uniref:HMG box domain-containing protein n=1 Tax=Smittium simulii TaxID=133385 RepID=A0A2T9YN26_9FUNG|nr:hypothetical protein BB561_003073 [Smittium simulii]